MLSGLSRHVDLLTQAISRTTVEQDSSKYSYSYFSPPAKLNFLSAENIDTLKWMTHFLDNVHDCLSNDEKECLKKAAPLIQARKKKRREKKAGEKSIENKTADATTITEEELTTEDLRLLTDALLIIKRTEHASKAAKGGNPFNKEYPLKNLFIVHTNILNLLEYLQEAKKELSGVTYDVSSLSQILDAFVTDVETYQANLIDELLNRICSLPENIRFALSVKIKPETISDEIWKEWLNCNEIITTQGNNKHKKKLNKAYGVIEGVIDGVPLENGNYYYSDELNMSFLLTEETPKSIIDLMTYSSSSLIASRNKDLTNSMGLTRSFVIINSPGKKEDVDKLIDEFTQIELNLMSSLTDSNAWEKIEHEPLAFSMVLVSEKKSESKKKYIPEVTTATRTTTDTNIPAKNSIITNPDGSDEPVEYIHHPIKINTPKNVAPEERINQLTRENSALKEQQKKQKEKQNFINTFRAWITGVDGYCGKNNSFNLFSRHGSKGRTRAGVLMEAFEKYFAKTENITLNEFKIFIKEQMENLAGGNYFKHSLKSYLFTFITLLEPKKNRLDSDTDSDDDAEMSNNSNIDQQQLAEMKNNVAAMHTNTLSKLSQEDLAIQFYKALGIKIKDNRKEINEENAKALWNFRTIS